jgi:hypothetical protein
MMFEDLEGDLITPARRGRPSLRQPSAPISEPLIRSESWWMTVKPGEMTKRAEQERARMSKSPESRSVPDSILGKWISGVGVVRS